MTESAAPGGGSLAPRPAFVAAALAGLPVGSESERTAAAALARDLPEYVEAQLETDVFRRRALRELAQQRICQIVVVGGGICTAEVAVALTARISAGARVAFVDDDRQISAHLRARLVGYGTTVAVTADLTNPDTVLDHPALRDVIDLRAPVGLMLIGAVDRLAGRADTPSILARYIRRLPAGSLLAVTAGTLDGLPDTDRARWHHHTRHHLPHAGISAADFAAALEGLDLLGPGITAARDWTPGHDARAHPAAVPRVYAAIGRTR
ncbi:SAM-dependent methyltransferase [Catenuloplanes atrovinosus]|uniref:S-adenosyl methyltransferase n=1 Tax=Catenuloplanes atrovinosus TaxID=137266 RepID=A0AAE3YSM9_9ACTN|nr:SAM-dependent methyltransferase [Catenuloplanes atrovinosus]MDR7277698.1 hypothetical protein [Catenuloplanes atrovinosus]